MYGKLFAQMYEGTLATKGPWQALVTFQQFIILSDKYGVVDMTPEAIARRTTIPLQIIQEGLPRLMEPDPQSRSPDDQGRRITLLSDSRDWGWQIVNYDHYRKIRSSEERREYLKNYQRALRAEIKSVNKNVNMLTSGTQCQPIAVSSKHKSNAAVLPDWVPVEAWNNWLAARPVKATPRAKILAVEKLAKLRAAGHDPKDVLEQSTLCGYRGLFELKSGPVKSHRADGLSL